MLRVLYVFLEKDMYASVSQSRPPLQTIPLCVLFAIALGGALTPTVRGAISTDVSAHVPRLPPLLISASAWTVEAEAFSRQGLAPLNVRTEYPRPANLRSPLMLSIQLVSSQNESAQIPLQVNSRFSSPTHPGLLFEHGMRLASWPRTTPAQALIVKNGVPFECMHIMTAARDSAAPQTEGTIASHLNMLNSIKPLAVEYVAENFASAKPQVECERITVCLCDMPDFSARHPMSIRSKKLADGSGLAAHQMIPPETKVVFRTEPDDYTRTVEQRLVVNVLDEAEHGKHTKLGNGLKRELLAIVAHNTSTESSYRAFSALLADATGTNDLERGQSLLAWTAREEAEYDLNRLIYFTALHHYRSLQYDAALKQINRYLADQDAHGSRNSKDDFLMLKALCAWGEGNDGVSAISVVNEMLDEYPDSPLVPHALFLRAWVNLYGGNTGAARAGFAEVISRHPQSDFAARARQVLAGLPAAD